jgi:CRISPR type III-B/RAMP module RAMP protein Cmr6
MTLKNHTPAQGVLPSEWSASSLGGSFNPGLVHQRYAGLPLSARRGRDAKDVGSNAKIVAETFRDAFRAAREQGLPVLTEQQARLDRALKGHAGWTFAAIDLELAAPLAVGLGNEHPLENGMTFHHTLGVPFLPGTSVKGVLRAWCELFGELSPDGLAELFGNLSDAAAQDQRMGRLVCLDALPVGWPELDLDLSNCHLPAYYRGPGQRERNPGAVPRENPVPAVFLTVRSATFRFRLGAHEDAGIDVHKAIAVLAEALTTLGIGAKTAAGYGVFKAKLGAELTAPTEITRRSAAVSPASTSTGGHLFQVFLSHASVDKPAVMELATQLTRRGVVPWLDLDELLIGDPLTESLQGAIVDSTAVAALLSPASLGSAWVGDELQQARALERPATPGAPVSRVLPALWGLTERELAADDRFAEWFRADGRLDRLVAKGERSQPDALALQVVRAAAKLRALFAVPALQVVCDQRGKGARVGAPNHQGVLPLPTLVYRPDRGERADNSMVHGEAWLAWRDAMRTSLDAVGWPKGVQGTRPKLRLHLRCQYAVAMWLGAYFDRTTTLDLAVYDNFRPERDRELTEAGLEPPTWVEPTVVEAAPGRTLDLMIWHEGKFDPTRNVTAYRAGSGVSGPLYSLCRGQFTDEEDVTAWASQLAGWVQRQDKPPVRLYLGCPLFAAVALARALTKVEAASIELLEWDFEAGTYRACRVR